MSLEHAYPYACSLSRLGWLKFTRLVRVKKLAYTYIEARSDLRAYCRRLKFDTVHRRSLKVLIDHHCPPAHGDGKSFLEDTALEVGRQLAVRKKRAQNKPFEFIKPSVTAMGKSDRATRIAMAKTRFTRKDGSPLKASSYDFKVAEIGTVNGYKIIVQSCDFGINARIYFERGSFRRQVVLSTLLDAKSFGDIVVAIGGKAIIRKALSGCSVKLDPRLGGFTVDGAFYPWTGIVQDVSCGDGSKLATFHRHAGPLMT